MHSASAAVPIQNKQYGSIADETVVATTPFEVALNSPTDGSTSFYPQPILIGKEELEPNEEEEHSLLKKSSHQHLIDNDETTPHMDDEHHWTNGTQLEEQQHQHGEHSHKIPTTPFGKFKYYAKKVLNYYKIVTLWIVMMIGIGFFASAGEVEESKTFSISTAHPLLLRANDTLPKYFVRVEMYSPRNEDERHGDENSPLLLDTPLNQVIIYFEAMAPNSTKIIPISNATLTLQNIYQANESQTVEHVFETPNQLLDHQLRLLVTSNQVKPVVLQVLFTQHPIYFNLRIPLAFLLLVFIYVLIIFEFIDRTVSTMIGAFLTISLLTAMRLKPSMEEIIDLVEFKTLLLLFGMMTTVSIFSQTGFFEWMALKSYKISRGNIWFLVFIISFISAFASSILDNVTTMLLLAPAIVRLSKVIAVSPIPILLCAVISSNIGGCATAIGDPPVILIVNTAAIRMGGVGFNEILFYMAPGATIIFFVCFAVLRLLFLFEYRKKPVQLTPELVHLMKEKEIWTETRLKLKADGADKKSLQNLVSMIKSIDTKINQKLESQKVVDTSPLEKEYQIRNWPLFIICSSTLCVVVLFFFLETFINKWVHLPLEAVAICGALTVLILSDWHEYNFILEKIEWSTLLFFATLFIMMGGLEKLNIISFIGDGVASLIGHVDPRFQLFVAISLITWLSSIVSAIIDSIPYVTSMIPVVLSISENLNLPLKPLVFALAFGSGLGGNATLIASTANLVVAGISEKSGYRISFLTFMKIGFPVMLVSTFMANIYLLIIHLGFGLGLTNPN